VLHELTVLGDSQTAVDADVHMLGHGQNFLLREPADPTTG
jgi:hypothetical protein